MSVNYEFNVSSVKKRNTVGDFTDVVISAFFEVHAWTDAVFTGTEEEGNVVVTRPMFSYRCSGTIDFSTDDLDSSSFVDFSSITKDTIKGWIMSAQSITDIEDHPYVTSAVSHIRSEIETFNIEVDTTVGGDATTGTLPETE